MVNLKGLHERYQSLSLRERSLLFVTSLAIIWGLWLTALGGRLSEQVDVQVNALAALTQQLSVQHNQLQTLKKQSRSSQVAQLKEERNQLRDELRLVEDEVDLLLDKFIPAEQIPLLLEDVLRSHRGLELISIRTKPARRVSMQLQQDRENGGAEVEIFRHPIQIEFSGGFADVLGYVDELERSDWNFAWRRLEYVVRDYPRAVVLLEVETLSDEMEWLGV